MRIAFIAVWLLCFAPLLATAAEPPSRPNVVLFVVDDQRWDTLGCMGNEVVQTPHIDALARRGCRFTNAFCTTSICATSRSTILSGQYGQGFPQARIPKSEAIRTVQWKYVRYPGQEPVFEELFNLEADPLETRNLAGEREYADTLQQLRAEADRATRELR